MSIFNLGSIEFVSLYLVHARVLSFSQSVSARAVSLLRYLEMDLMNWSRFWISSVRVSQTYNPLIFLHSETWRKYYESISELNSSDLVKIRLFLNLVYAINYRITKILFFLSALYLIG